MSTPAYLSQPQIQRLPIILSELMSGALLIPRFQRPSTWDDEQRLYLMDSIRSGLPIGSILVWRTLSHHLPIYEHLGALRFHVPSQDPASTTGLRQYLLDGHQRLGTLYGALALGIARSRDLDLSHTPSDHPPPKPIYYDLQNQEFALQPDEIPPNWLPLSILLDPSALWSFQGQLLEKKYPRNLVNRVEHLANTFKDYSIPIIPFVAEDLEVVTTSFKRINSAGTPMGEVHMIRALTWTSDFDLSERLNDLRHTLASVGWQNTDDRILFPAIKLALGLDVYKAQAEDVQTSLQKNPSIFDEVAVYFQRAARFLRERCGICGPNVLPYSFQAVVVCAWMQQAGPIPPDDALESLRRWFWITTYTEHFAGMNSTTLRRALEYTSLLLQNPTAPPQPQAHTTVRPSLRFDYRSARSRAWALRLAHLNPLGLDSKSRNPHDLLALHGNDAIFPLIHPRRLSAKHSQAPWNRILSPPKEGLTLSSNLINDPLSIPEAIRHSHLIDLPTAEALYAGDFERALDLRRDQYLAIEIAFVEALGLTFSSDAPF